MKKLLTPFVLVLALVFAPFMACEQDLPAHASYERPAIGTNDEVPESIGYKRYIPTLDDDFADNRVIVTMKQEYSDVNKAVEG